MSNRHSSCSIQTVVLSICAPHLAGAETYAKLYPETSSDGVSSPSHWTIYCMSVPCYNPVPRCQKLLKVTHRQLSFCFLQILRLGNVVPDFTAETTHGPMKWHEWIDGSWAVSLLPFSLHSLGFYLNRTVLCSAKLHTPHTSME